MIPTDLTAAEKTRAKKALGAMIEQLDGEELSTRRLADVNWLRRRVADSGLREALEAMPKGIYCQLAGRRHNQIDHLAAKHRIPIDGATIDMGAAMRRIHDLLTEMRAAGSDDYPEGEFPELEKRKLQEEIVKLQRQNERLLVQIDEDHGRVIPRDSLRDRLSWLSLRLRALGQQLRKTKGGPDAQRTLNEFLTQLADEVADGVLAS